MRLGLLLIGGIYTLRGLQLIPQVVATLQGTFRGPQRFLCLSALSLAIGVCYLVATERAWKDLGLSSHPLTPR